MPTAPQLFAFRGQMLSVKEIAKRMHLEESTIRWRIRNGVALDAPNQAGKGLGESGEYEIGTRADHLYWEDDLEARVWHLYCGGDDYGECALEEIGLMWGLSRERIRQIEEKAIRKIRAKAVRGNKDALACLRLLRERQEARSRQRPGHWEWMEAQAPGSFDIGNWERTHSQSVVAALSGRGSDINKEVLAAAKRGAKAMRGRTRSKAGAM